MQSLACKRSGLCVFDPKRAARGALLRSALRDALRATHFDLVRAGGEHGLLELSSHCDLLEGRVEGGLGDQP